MNSDDLDISDSLNWEEGLPRPQWDLIESWAESHGDPDAKFDAWNAALRQWLQHLAGALAGDFAIAESDDFLVLAPDADTADRLVWFAGQCQRRHLTVLGSVAQSAAPGKQVIVALDDEEHYYRYISPFYAEGEHGGSAGLQIRDRYPHIVTFGKQSWLVESSVAHELTHASLQHLEMPQWIEEGLAQMFEHEMTGRALLELDAEMAARHKRYWGKHGLNAFWRGDGFSRPGKVQELSYQIAEILVRLLVEDGRPRWFGFVREPQHRFFAFLQEANAADCGEAACREELGFGISDLAARFLGPGDWSPSL